jgi:2'-5' RNA ligase
MRLFFAIPLPPDALQAAQAAQARLRSLSGAARISWANAAQLHFTLAFLGEQDEAGLARALQAGRSAAQHAAPFALSLGQPGAFPGPRRPRVLWLGADQGASAMEALASQLRKALREHALPFDDKPFHAHLTLARVQPFAARDAAGALQSFAPEPSPPFRAGSFSLVESTLQGAHGARHEVREEFALAAEEVP